MAAPVQGSALSVETTNLRVSGGAGVIAVIAALLVFHLNSVSLFGESNSVGLVTAILGGGLGGVAFVIAYLRSLANTQSKSVWLRRSLDTVALAINHVGLWVVLSLGAFFLLQRGFSGVRVDLVTAVALVGAAVFVAAYVMRSSAVSITPERVSTLLAVFIVSGVLASAITAPDQHWWMRNFSALGAMPGYSGFAFNATLIATGAMVVTLSDYLTDELRNRIQSAPRFRAINATFVRWALVALGIALGGVGIFPVNRLTLLHDIIASSTVVIFAVLVFATRAVFPGLPTTFLVFGYALVGVLVVVVVLYVPIDYYNLTAVEIAAFAAILGWLVTLIRVIGALRAPSPQARASGLR